MKIKDVTPTLFACGGGNCPAVYETDRQTYLIIGREVDLQDGLLSGKVGPDELVIEVPVDLLRSLSNLRRSQPKDGIVHNSGRKANLTMADLGKELKP